MKKLFAYALGAFIFAVFICYFFSIHITGFNMKNNYADSSFEQIKKDYEIYDAWGLHTTIDIKNCGPDLIRSAEAIKEYIVTLCDLIGMKRFGDPTVVHFGEDEQVAGFSMTQLIETSLISGHFANATNSIYIDVFSCKLYNPHVVAEFTKNYFKGGEYTLNVLLRK